MWRRVTVLLAAGDSLAAGADGRLEIVGCSLRMAALTFCFSICWAARGGHIDVVVALRKTTESCGWLRPMVSFSAARVRSRQCSTMVVCNLARLSMRTNYFAIRKAADGHLAVVERLLQDKRVDPSVDQNYAIRTAAEKGQLAASAARGVASENEVSEPQL